MRIKLTRSVLIASTAALVLAPLSKGEPSKQPASPEPIPAQVFTAKTVFVSNAPGDKLPSRYGSPNETYNQFYTSVKNWGHFSLAPTPADADLVLEVSFASSLAGVGASSNTGCSSSSLSIVKLVVVDPKTRTPLWWFAEEIVFKGHSLRGEKPSDAFSDAIGKLIEDLKTLGTASRVTEEHSKNQTYPSHTIVSSL